jgi:hypothetical protein
MVYTCKAMTAERQTNEETEMKAQNEIATARKAIKSAIKSGKIEKDASAMHRTAIQSLDRFSINDEMRVSLAWHAVKDVLFA